MGKITFRAVSAQEMRELDRRAVTEFGIPGIILMENAGRAAADAVESLREKTRGGNGRIAVLCGPGNNGGDGVVCARYLYNRGRDVRAVLMRPPERFKGDALAHYRMAERLALPLTAFAPHFSLQGYALVVDALLGTGTKGEITGDFRSAIELINESGLPVVSVDIPSGLDADTGALLGPTVRADVTVTMALPKKAFLSPQAKEFTGEVIVAEIGFPRQLLAPCP
ncbi:MAG: NAD(P)H-hydrate epimerase [Endomicrobiales bacterium]